MSAKSKRQTIFHGWYTFKRWTELTGVSMEDISKEKQLFFINFPRLGNATWNVTQCSKRHCQFYKLVY